jgi:hypothetical protein
MRAIVAGLLAALLGVGVGTTLYLAHPGAMVLDWGVMKWIVLAYAGFTGLLGGLGIGGGMILAREREGGPVRAWRLLSGATLGGLVGCMAPAVVGIAGFGSIDAPYLGTANILFSIWIGCTAFVTLWAPRLSTAGRMRTGTRIGLAALASIITFASLGMLGWTLVTSLALVPSFTELQALAWRIGLVNFSAVAGTLAGTVVGASMGLATWVYLALETAFRRSGR